MQIRRSPTDLSATKTNQQRRRDYQAVEGKELTMGGLAEKERCGTAAEGWLD
jgi:hypothetical protein